MGGDVAVRTVKAIYENGALTLLEPAALDERQEVAVIVPEEGQQSPSHILRFGGMLSDLESDELAAFDQALERGLTFKRRP